MVDFGSGVPKVSLYQNSASLFWIGDDMKKYLVLCMFTYFLFSGQTWAARNGGIVDFTLILRDDTVVRLDSRSRTLNIQRSAFKIVSYNKENDSFREVDRLDWPEITRTIYSIDLINSKRMSYSNAKLLLTRQDDSQFVIQFGSLYHHKDSKLLDGIHFSEYNRIADQWIDRKIPISLIKKVVLGTTRLKINSSTGTLYPPDYRYDPHTGERLQESALMED